MKVSELIAALSRYDPEYKVMSLEITTIYGERTGIVIEEITEEVVMESNFISKYIGDTIFIGHYKEERGDDNDN